MKAIEIARRMAALGQTRDACDAYRLSIHEGAEPVEEMEAALYLLQSGGDHRISLTSFQSLYNRGFFREDCLSIMTQAVYEPNVKALRTRYERNCKLLSRYPYLFRKDFLAFEELPVRLFPYDDKGFLPFDTREDRFGDYVNPGRQVVSRNFFQNLDRPILAEDVFSQYELEYLNDNVRKSEYVARENHIYLHYTDWKTFCSYLQCLNLRKLLEDKKVVFLIEEEIARYPIDFQAEFGLDYSHFPLKPLGVRELKRLIWHTQLSSHNGGDFFNEIFDAHPNLIAMPSIMFDNVEEVVETVRQVLNQSGSVREAAQRLPDWDRALVEELYLLKNRTDKDILVGLFLRDNQNFEKEHPPLLDHAARIVPALFFQPHFSNIVYELVIDRSNATTLRSKQYEKVSASPLFRGFSYIKTFTPMRRITTSHGATVKFMLRSTENSEESAKQAVVPDAVTQRVLNRSFMIDWQDRLYMDSVLVRFEDGKLNPKATFTALAAFLDLPYTQSMTYCSLKGELDPESLEGNDLGFSTAAIYRTYDDYTNDDERYFIEYFMRDAYTCYGYDFHYYDGAPVDYERAEKLISGFHTVDYYIRQTWKRVFEHAKFQMNGIQVQIDNIDAAAEQLVDNQLKGFRENRLKNARLLLRGLRFVNRHGQPLHMMPRLELDPALLEQPLYH
ncbi:MAG: hypothetical protein HFF50_10920 [Lawsonibacter sp.]|nr:hypothetical protein [Lawsonibacter sp.]